MQALAIIPDLNKVEYLTSQIVVIIVFRFYWQFCFKGFKEAFGRCETLTERFGRIMFKYGTTIYFDIGNFYRYLGNIFAEDETLKVNEQDCVFGLDCINSIAIFICLC